VLERSVVRVPGIRLLRGHRYRVSPGRIWTRERGLALALIAVVGPGILAGLSDDDPAGITTYSILGADFGYKLLWTLLVSTLALALFYDLTVRLGCATGQPVLRIDRLYRDRELRPLELAINHFNPDRYSYRLQLRGRVDHPSPGRDAR